jgi:hypothetical protein
MPASLSEIIIPVVASLSGALVAGWVSYIAGRRVRLHEWNLQLARERILERQRLYARFIAEADRNLLTVAAGGAKSVDNILPLFAFQAEIWLLSGPCVQKAATRMCDLAVSVNAAEEVRSDGDLFSAKKDFLAAARAELEALESNVRNGRVLR